MFKRIHNEVVFLFRSWLDWCFGNGCLGWFTCWFSWTWQKHFFTILYFIIVVEPELKIYSEYKVKIPQSNLTKSNLLLILYNNFIKWMTKIYKLLNNRFSSPLFIQIPNMTLSARQKLHILNIPLFISVKFTLSIWTKKSYESIIISWKLKLIVSYFNLIFIFHQLDLNLSFTLSRESSRFSIVTYVSHKRIFLSQLGKKIILYKITSFKNS